MQTLRKSVRVQHTTHNAVVSQVVKAKSSQALGEASRLMCRREPSDSTGLLIAGKGDSLFSWWWSITPANVGVANGTLPRSSSFDT